MRSYLGLGVAFVGLFAFGTPLFAADYAVSPLMAHKVSHIPYIDRGPNPYCGPRCGSPIVVHVRHKSLQQAYPYTFDPRTRDEPSFYYGGVRTYVRFANPAYPERVLQY